MRSGSSGASVFRVQENARCARFLKIANGECADDLRREIERTKWLALHHVNVPVVLQTVVDAEICAVLMSALQGCPVEDCGGSPSNIVVAVAAGLAQLHALPIKSCPFDESIEIRLARAQADICRRPN
jgi:aminoglycoside 3'-phosphotransferase-2